MPAPRSWWDDDPELARLRFDSALPGADDPAPAEPAPPRRLTFVARQLTIELEVGPTGLNGRVVPGRPGMAALQGEDSPSLARAVLDAAGRFCLTAVPAGLVRLRIDTLTGLVVVTDAFTP